MNILPILQNIPVLSNLNEKDHHKIIENIEIKFFAKDMVVFNEGEPGDAMYIIENGKVLIYHPRPGKPPKEIATLTHNDFFGEMALISEQPRSATAKTIEETVLLQLKKEDFHLLLSQNPEIATRISMELMHRVKENLRNEN